MPLNIRNKTGIPTRQGGGGGGAITVGVTDNDTANEISTNVSKIIWATEALGFSATPHPDDPDIIVIGDPPQFEPPLQWSEVANTLVRVSESDITEPDTYETATWENTTKEATLSSSPPWNSTLDRGLPDNYRYGRFLTLQHYQEIKTDTLGNPDPETTTRFTLIGDGDDRRNIGYLSRSLNYHNGDHYACSMAARIGSLEGGYETISEDAYDDINKLATIPKTKRVSSRFVANVGSYNLGLLQGQSSATFSDALVIHPNEELYQNWEYSYSGGLYGTGLTGTLLITLANGLPDYRRTMKVTIVSDGHERVSYLGNDNLCILTTIKGGYTIYVELENNQTFQFGEMLHITRFP
ncbi:hypothetical protein [Pseudoalteromonas phage J2-1_QLiu-2017]|nr:hypothetical protein [Pseudoalteromonas phage J2-1_QLiu-2017]